MCTNCRVILALLCRAGCYTGHSASCSGYRQRGCVEITGTRIIKDTMKQGRLANLYANLLNFIRRRCPRGVFQHLLRVLRAALRLRYGTCMPSIDNMFLTALLVIIRLCVVWGDDTTTLPKNVLCAAVRERSPWRVQIACVSRLRLRSSFSSHAAVTVAKI